MSETRNIVVLGASYAGLGAAHSTLKRIVPSLPSTDKVSYRVVLVDPSEKWYITSASPRAVASAKLMPDETMFRDIKSAFEHYGTSCTFINGSATAWNMRTCNVTITKPDGQREILPYHALILATGSRTHSPIFSLQGKSHEEVKSALHAVREKLLNAKRIVVAGGGPTGVETAAEIGDQLNGEAGYFSSRPRNPKVEVLLITSASNLLPVLRPAIAKQAETYLNRFGVDVRYNTKVHSSKELPNGQTTITLHDGEEITADVYIPSTGVIPMSGYVPKTLLNDQGFVRMNERTMRVDEAGPRVYAVGDIGSYSRNSILDIHSSIPVLETNLKRDLLAAHDDPNAKPSGDDRLYTPAASETQLVAIGRTRGVGAAFGWKMPDFVVAFMKSKDYMMPKAVEILDGQAWAKEA